MAGQRRARQGADPARRPHWLDTCHAHASSSPVVKARFPQHYTGK
jgi:hypothetical protein